MILASVLAALASQAGSPAEPCAAAPTWATAFAPNLSDSARLFRGTFGPDGRTLYYFRKTTLGQEDYRILVSRYGSGGWSPGERLDLGGDFSDLYPSVSPDGKRLVFASYRPAPGDTASTPNAYLWYADRRGMGWGPPHFIGSAAQFGTYHSGPIIAADYSIRFHRTSGDWRTTWSRVSRWDGKRYLGSEPIGSADPGERWRDWQPGRYYVWGGQLAPGGDLAILDISPIDRRGQRAPAQVWISVRQGEDWSEPRPAGGGVNGSGGTNFVAFSPDGCSVIYVRGFTRFEAVSLEALAGPARARAGEIEATELERPEGLYRGAYVQAGSVQLVDAEVVRRGDTLRITSATPDWPLWPPRVSLMSRDSAGRYRFATPFGQAVTTFDTRHGDLAGSITGEDLPPVTLHLKRSLAPPRPAVVREDLTVASAGVTLAGTYVRPADAAVRAALVVTPGRGCAGRAGGVRLLEALAPYGVAGIALDKRGVGQSGGTCRYATIDDLTSDALAAFEALARRVGRDTVKLGFLGGSAGGWVIVRAAARAAGPVDFLITVAGPAVSVEAQQRDNARSITRRLGLTPAQERRATRYLDLMFATGNQAVRYAEMQEIVAWAKEVGFAQEFFEDSDIPASAALVDSLWVTLNNYDPAPDLRRLDLPLLAFFGEADEVVPPRENVAALRRHAARNPRLRTRIVVVPDGDHGMGLSGGVTRMQENVHLYRFDRLSPVYLEGVVEFLRGLSGAR
jgi:alpha-beta hydrolase superfamily lysophospholipase